MVPHVNKGRLIGFSHPVNPATELYRLPNQGLSYRAAKVASIWPGQVKHFSLASNGRGILTYRNTLCRLGFPVIRVVRV